MKLIHVAAFAVALGYSGVVFGQKNPPLQVCLVEHENTDEISSFDLKKAADSLNYKGKSYKLYTANYPQILLKEKEGGATVITVPFDEDMEKPGEGLRRTLRFEKRQINNEGMPELIIHWENWTDSYHSYKGIKVIDLERTDCLLDQVVFKSIETPADTTTGEAAKKVEFKRYVKLSAGEILIEDLVQTPDAEENDDFEELMTIPSGLYKGGGAKNKFTWNKLPEKPLIASSKNNKKDKKE